jgi:hypothetical protein
MHAYKVEKLSFVFQFILTNVLVVKNETKPKGNLTDKALKTKGSPDILLLAMLKCVKRLPTVVTKSDRHVLETALRELHDDGWKRELFIK